MKVNYIYFTSSMVAVGEYEAEDKETASKEIHTMIREKTNEQYSCLISDKIDFVSEAEKAEDIDEYIKQLVSDINIK